jgi:hypothetical protein
MSDTPSTDEVASHEGSWDTKALRMTHYARYIERELAEVTKQRDNLIKELEYIAHSGLSARHLVDHAIASIKAMEGGAQ